MIFALILSSLSLVSEIPEGLSDQEILNLLQNPKLEMSIFEGVSTSNLQKLIEAAHRANGSSKPRLHPAVFAALKLDVDQIFAFEFALPDTKLYGELKPEDKKRVETAFTQYMQTVMSRLGGLDGCADVAKHLGLGN